MYSGRSTHNQNFIPSFQTIDFRLSSKNLSQYPSLCDYNNAYQAGSLTYTESEIDQINSMRFLQQPVTSLNNFSESFMNIDIDLVNKPQKIWHQQQQNQVKNLQTMELGLEKKPSKQTIKIEQIKKQGASQQSKQKLFSNDENTIIKNRKKPLQNKSNNKVMNRKKSILMINNIELNFYDNMKNNNYFINHSINNNNNNNNNSNNRNKPTQKKKLFENNLINNPNNNNNNHKNNNNINNKSHDKQQRQKPSQQTIMTNASIHVRSNISSGKLSILSRSRKSSICSQSTATNNLLSPPTTQQSIGSSILVGSPYSHKTQANNNDGSDIYPLSSLVKKRCFSELRRPKSSKPISSSQGSSLCCILKKQNYQSLMKQLQRKISNNNSNNNSSNNNNNHHHNLSALSIDSNIDENKNINIHNSNSTRQMNKRPVTSKTQQKMKQLRRRNFLQDAVPLNQIMNVKQIKLQQNSHVEKNYLRKIIQNRVAVHHFDQQQILQNNKC